LREQKENESGVYSIAGGIPLDGLGSYSGVPVSQNIDKLYEIPDACPAAHKIIRGVYTRDLGNSILRLSHRHAKFHNTMHQDLLECKIAETAAEGGGARVEALMTSVGLLAPDIFRVARGLPKHENKGQPERVESKADFNKKDQAEK
jgi:hypothetical protein